MPDAALPQLAKLFQPEEAYRERQGEHYALLPFRFLPLDDSRYILSNMTGEFVVFDRNTLYSLVHHQLAMESPIYEELKSKHFVIDQDSNVAIDLLATKFRTHHHRLASLTSLFLFVVTLRCEHSCPYCQVSRRTQNKEAFDMSTETAMRGIDLVFESPANAVKVEFQGGEPLLNFDMIRYVTETVKERNREYNKQVAFVIATNLALVNEEILLFCKEHEIQISTSLDGPAHLHNSNRPRPGNDSFERTIDGIKLVRSILGENSLSALMTTTGASLSHVEAIIDEYRAEGFNSIFLRSLSPYGFAVKSGAVSGYDIDAWLSFYKQGLRHILDLNHKGAFFIEEYAALLLRKILTPFPTGYVDLQSPAGIGLACLAINYDGFVYPSDEARMLAEMRDFTFRLGHVKDCNLKDLLTSEQLIGTLASTATECMPLCADCGIQPYCGSDPVFHYTTQGDVVGLKAASSFCKKNMEIIRHLLILLEDHPADAEVLRSWL